MKHVTNMWITCPRILLFTAGVYEYLKIYGLKFFSIHHEEMHIHRCFVN